MALRPLKVARLLVGGFAATAGISLWSAGAADAAVHRHFTGYGFDTCSAPSIHALRAWKASPFRALNIYIGGGNRACSQPHLNAAWVRTVTAMGWRLIPTYVSLQAPRSSCRCHPMNVRRANQQGVAAANNAVRAAERLGIRRGNPIYDDMESYARTRRNTRAVTAFLQGWTGRLHRLGYVSGVYSSSATGISDLVSRVRTSFAKPNDIWVADWNRRATTANWAVPARYWSHVQRIHQYRGSHRATYGGVTIYIDTDYCHAAIVSHGTLGPPR